MPDGLHALAAAEWERLTPIARSAGLLSAADWLPWRLGFYSLSRYFRAQDALTAGSALTFATQSGYVQQRPEVGIARQAWSEVMQWAREFGLTPAARTAVGVAIPDAIPRESGPDDPLADLLN